MNHKVVSKSIVKGFTLIELLVVIAIIGLLATIVAAPIQSARKKAKDTKKISEVRQLRTSFANYANDTGGYPSGSTTITSNILSLSPQYIPSIPQGLNALNARDKYMYVSYSGIAPGSSATTTFAYHLGVSLEVFNTVLLSDDSCWGAVSTSTPGVTGNKNGGGCATFVSADIGSTLLPVYFGATNSAMVGPAVKTLGGMTSTVNASSTYTFNGYNYIGHPFWPGQNYDFNGEGVGEFSTSTCTTVDQCIYDVTDYY